MAQFYSIVIRVSNNYKWQEGLLVMAIKSPHPHHLLRLFDRKGIDHISKVPRPVQHPAAVAEYSLASSVKITKKALNIVTLLQV